MPSSLGISLVPSSDRSTVKTAGRLQSETAARRPTAAPLRSDDLVMRSGDSGLRAIAAACAVFAAAFFSTGMATANADAPATNMTAAPVPAGYVIHDRDVLQVQVSNDPTLSQTVTVLPGGDISYPLVGKIHVGGLTPDQASKTIAAALKTYVRHPFVSVVVAQVGTLNVLVLGNVKTPGKYALLPNARVTDAI